MIKFVFLLRVIPVQVRNFIRAKGIGLLGKRILREMRFDAASDAGRS